jgi:transmembrane sensor
MDKKDAAQIEQQAARWFAAMRGPRAEQERANFEAWLDQDVCHRAAYAQVSSIFENSRVLRASARYGLSRKRRPFINVRNVLVPAAIAASIAGGLVIGLDHHGALSSSSYGAREERMTFATPPRTIQTFTLPGGAALALDQSSKAIVSAGEKGTRIELISGRMQLQAERSDASYTIAAGPNAITVRAGVVDVYRAAPDESFVRLYSGHAEARPLLQNAAYIVEGRSLPAGRPLRLIRGVLVDARESFETSEQDWPSGWAQYRTIPLSQLLGIANRYAAKPIVLDDPVLGAKAVSGRFRFNDASSVARNLAAIFDLAVTERSDGIYLQRR